MDRFLAADEVMARMVGDQRLSLIDDAWINEKRVGYGLPPFIKGPGYVEPRSEPWPAATSVGVTPPPPTDTDVLYFDPSAPGVKALGDGRYELAVSKEEVKRQVNRLAPRGTVWVLAADYTRFRAWCLDHGIDPLNKHLVGFASPGLWDHWLQGHTDLYYALGYGAEERLDRELFLAFMAERGAEEWEPSQR